MLKLYNTLTRKEEEFKPLKDNIATFYQCGPTIYSHQHIGNLYSAVKGDLIRRALMYLGYKVNYTRNITDVGHLVSDDDEGEDKMEKGARREKSTPEQIANKYTKIYHEDLDELNVLPPDNETVATHYIEQMAQMVQELINKGYAYATDQAIYFDVTKFKNYTALNRQNLEKNIKGAGHGDKIDKDKRHSYDFVLWFFKTGAHKNALQTWEHEFDGIMQTEKKGFPGWHIECSAMAKDTLGKTIDIHMGGIEHIPVHHTNEIAQSEAANETQFVRYWLHHEMLEVNGKKMSKSIGNIFTLNDVVAKGFDPMDLRYFFLQSHYRSKQNFTWEALESARNARKKLKVQIMDLPAKNKQGEIDQAWKDKFTQALEKDINIPKALAVMWEILKSPDEKTYASLIDFDKVFGLNVEKWSSEKEKEITYSEEMQKLIKEREKARKSGNYDKADEIRVRLEKEFNIKIEDTPEGSKYKISRN